MAAAAMLPFSIVTDRRARLRCWSLERHLCLLGEEEEKHKGPNERFVTVEGILRWLLIHSVLFDTPSWRL